MITLYKGCVPVYPLLNRGGVCGQGSLCVCVGGGMLCVQAGVYVRVGRGVYVGRGGCMCGKGCVYAGGGMCVRAGLCVQVEDGV